MGVEPLLAGFPLQDSGLCMKSPLQKGHPGPPPPHCHHPLSWGRLGTSWSTGAAPQICMRGRDGWHSPEAGLSPAGPGGLRIVPAPDLASPLCAVLGLGVEGREAAPWTCCGLGVGRCTRHTVLREGSEGARIGGARARGDQEGATRARWLGRASGRRCHCRQRVIPAPLHFHCLGGPSRPRQHSVHRQASGHSG